MGYEVALQKSWQELKSAGAPAVMTVRFLADTYELQVGAQTMFSRSCNVPAKPFAAILILHYLAQKVKALPPVTGEWLPFRELSGIEGYDRAFHNRAIEPIIRKYGKEPKGILEVISRLPGRELDEADTSIVIDAFEGVPVRISMWAGDDEFPADANMFMDRSVREIFCTEDIAVLGQLVAMSV